MSYKYDSAERMVSNALMYLREANSEGREQYAAGYEAGFAAASKTGNRTMNGAQFIARLMNCVSPESAGWAELHRLSQSGFGRNIAVEVDE